jgi:predicted nucleic acid-binding Zn finger protein
VDGYTITRINPDSFDVFNESNEAVYQVDLVKKGWTCTCPHFTYRLSKTGGECKHIVGVRTCGAWNKQVKLYI